MTHLLAQSRSWSCRLHYLNHTARLPFTVLSKELRKTHLRAGLHRRMDEKLNAMVGPHSPLPLPRMRNENQLEVDPVGIDAIIDAVVGLNPIAIDIAGIRLLGTKAAVKVNFLNAGRPKSLDGGAEPLQQPSTTRREPEALGYLVQRCSKITRRQRTGTRVKDRYQSSSILSETKTVVNIYAVSVHYRPKCDASAKARASGCRLSKDSSGCV